MATMGNGFGEMGFVSEVIGFENRESGWEAQWHIVTVVEQSGKMSDFFNITDGIHGMKSI